jgi:hypothetical protein
MNTPVMLRCMALIMAMTVKSDQIGDVIFSTLTSRGEMVHLYHIVFTKKQFAVPTFSLLPGKQGPQPTLCERVGTPQPFGPIEQIAVIGTGISFHLHVPLDRNTGMISQRCTLWRGKSPLILSHRSPIFPCDPIGRFVRVSVLCPSEQHWKQMIVAVVEDFLGGHTTVVA